MSECEEEGRMERGAGARGSVWLQGKTVDVELLTMSLPTPQKIGNAKD